MDIKREPPKKRGKYIMIGAGVVVLAITTVMLGNLEARPPSVDRATLWIRRGTKDFELFPHPPYPTADNEATVGEHVDGGQHLGGEHRRTMRQHHDGGQQLCC